MNIITLDCTTAAPRNSSKGKTIMESISTFLLVMNRQSVSATFFISESFLKSYPELIKEIHDENHDIGYLSGAYINIDDFEEALKNNTSCLSSLTGSKIRSYKQTGYTITTELTWVYPVLARHGFTASNSVMNHTILQNPAISTNKPDKAATVTRQTGNPAKAATNQSPSGFTSPKMHHRSGQLNENSLLHINHLPFVIETNFGNIIEHPASNYKILNLRTNPFSAANLKHLPYFIHNFHLQHNRNNIIALNISYIPAILKSLNKITTRHIFQTLQQSGNVNSHLDIPRLDLKTRMVKN